MNTTDAARPGEQWVALTPETLPLRGQRVVLKYRAHDISHRTQEAYAVAYLQYEKDVLGNAYPSRFVTATPEQKPIFAHCVVALMWLPPDAPSL